MRFSGCRLAFARLSGRTRWPNWWPRLWLIPWRWVLLLAFWPAALGLLRLQLDPAALMAGLFVLLVQLVVISLVCRFLPQ